MKNTKLYKTQEELIITKSSGLFWEKGYSETSMKDIGEACGFRPANIYNFFKSKESILFQILHDEMEEILEPIRHLKDNDAVDPREALKLVIENHVKLTLGERRYSKMLFDSGLNNLSKHNRAVIIKLRDEYNVISEEIIRRGVEMKIFPNIDEKLTVYCIASMIARSRIWYSPSGKYNVDEIIEFIYTFSLFGLTGKKV